MGADYSAAVPSAFLLPVLAEKLLLSSAGRQQLFSLPPAFSGLASLGCRL